jgi:hypothetical protein
MVSTQTLEMVAEDLYIMTPGDGRTKPKWGDQSDGVRMAYREFAARVIETCRLPNEIDLRKRLLSDDARVAAGAEIDFYLPEGFLFPPEHSEMDTGDLFVAALVAALAETSG